MGGVGDGGVDIGINSSPRQAAIENAQAELRKEYDVREQRRLELEFLEKGGDPLDFRFGNVTSSLQSTSLNDHHREHFLSSEAKGSFALAASPHGDSVDSSVRPGAPSLRGRNGADNPVPFVGENQMREGEKHSTHTGRKNITSSEQSSQMGGNRNAKESEDSAIFRPYARRNRSRTNRDGGRLSSADAIHNRGGQGTSLATRAGLRDGKGSSSDINNQKDKNAHSTSKPKIVSANGDMVSRTPTPESRLDLQIDDEQALLPITGLIKQSALTGDKFETTVKGLKDTRHKQSFGNRRASADVAYKGKDTVAGEEGLVSSGVDELPLVNKQRDGDVSGKLSESGDTKVDLTPVTDKSHCVCETTDRKDLESGMRPSVGLDVGDNATCNDEANISSRGSTAEQRSEPEIVQKLEGSETTQDQNAIKTVENKVVVSKESSVAHLNQFGNGVIAEEDVHSKSTQLIKAVSAVGECEDKNRQLKEENVGGTEKFCKQVFHNDRNINKETSCVAIPPTDRSSLEASTSSISRMESAAPDCQPSGNYPRAVDKAYEDSILEEARIIEAKRRRIAELSVRSLLVESRQRCQWDYVLEEMTWLANDFAQERLWKMTAAAQLCHRVASASRLRFEEQSRQRNLKSVAHGLAKAVLQFWRSAEALLNGGGAKHDLKCNQLEGLHGKSDDVDSGGKTGDPETESCGNLLLQTGLNTTGSIQGYAVRFLRDSKSHVYPLQVKAPATPDIVHLDMMDFSWDNNLTEESLFYTVPSGATEIYRKSIQSYVTEFERTGSNVQEELGTSVFSTVAEQGYQDIAYEDEAETGTFYMSRTFGDGRLSKSALKKRKHPIRSYEQRADLPYGHYAIGAQSSTLIEKRPNLHVGPAPPKRMRTASRQRVINPFGPGPNAGIYSQGKNDASSGDTNSFHDDQIAINGGSRVQKSMEAESAGEFEKDLPYDFAETSTRPKKKKKKPKHPESTFEQGWQLGPAVLNDQREQSKKRLDHFESNGTSGLYGQHNAKRPKKSLDDTYDNSMAVPGSVPGQMASQMSNMSNQNKFIRYMGGRDKGRKVKALKTSSLHSGPGSTWSLFEDQALVVLVHDMGPNWELVSDAINSTLQFKCIFRKPKECKERHKCLMDKTVGDGADSAEDSGSSQPYPSTLPGIPKGSAMQLFQRLQSPVEEDTLKEHFDKIIQITQRQHHRRIQLKNERQDTKQIAVHNSHFVSLSQVCPNNLSGGFNTPLDLIEATAPSSDVLPLNYQGTHSGNLGVSNHGAVSSAPTTTATNSPLSGGSAGGAHGSNVLSQSVPFSAPSRDGRYTVPKTSSSQGGDEQQPQQQQQQRLPYNPMLSGRAMPHSNLTSPGSHPGSERGGRVLPPGNGLGINRNMPMSRPGFQGIGSSTMLNSGSVVGTPSPVTMHSGANQGNSMLRPREPLHMVRGVAPELPMHAVNQGTAQGVKSFNGMGPAFSNQTSSPVQTYPGHSQQQPHSPQLPPHAPNSPRLPGANQQQMYLRLAKDRNLQQRYLHQQQFGAAASNNLMPPLQNNPPTSQPTPSSPMTPAPLHPQQKPQLQPHGLARNTSTPIGGPTNQAGKQRQRQPQQQFQQSGRQHPQVRPQQQLQGKLVKGINRGSMLVHQKLPIDPSHMNGLNVVPTVDNKEGSGLYSGSSTNPTQPPLPSSPAVPKQHQVPTSLSENSATSTSSTVTASIKQQPGQLQQQPHQNQAQVPGQRMLPLSRQMSLPIKSQPEKAQVEKKHAAGAAMTPTTTDSTNKVSPGSSAALPLQRRASEALSDAELPSTSGQVGSSIGSSTIQNSVRGEPLPSSLSQGSVGQKNLSDNTMAHRGGLGSQWQQQPQAKQALAAAAAAAAAPQSSSSKQLEQQQPPPLQAQPQTQHLQAAQGNSFVGSANS